MASLTAANVLNKLEGKFSYKAMQEMMKYMATYNCESQVFAIDANSEDVQTTGTKMVMLNGQPVKLAADAALDISADTEGTLTAWATATAYSVGDVRSHTSVRGTSLRYRCIAAHTSDSDKEPQNGADWETYWEIAPHGAVNASGVSIAKSKDQWFLATAKADGTITLWKAGSAASTGEAECKVPQYDPKMYVAIGFLHIANGTSSAFVVGTTGLDTASVTDSFLQAVGPVFPHPDNWDSN